MKVDWLRSRSGGGALASCNKQNRMEAFGINMVLTPALAILALLSQWSIIAMKMFLGVFCARRS